MSVTSKSPVKIVLAALAAARRSLPAYRHKCSPKKFTQHQSFACLVLKSALKLDYRGVTAVIKDSEDLFEALGIYAVPHYTTLQKASRRLLKQTAARKLLGATPLRNLSTPTTTWSRRPTPRVTTSLRSTMPATARFHPPIASAPG